MNTNPSLNRPIPTRIRLFRPLALLLLAGAITGCTMVRYSGAHGETFTRTSFGAQTSLAALEVEADTNGVRRFQLHGYQNETAQALGTITEAAIRAALSTNR